MRPLGWVYPSKEPDPLQAPATQTGIEQDVARRLTTGEGKLMQQFWGLAVCSGARLSR